MSYRRIFAGVVFFLFLPLAAVVGLDTKSLTPTSPPKVPISDFGDGGHRVLDLMYMHYEFEDFSMDGGSVGFNYINNIDAVGYNLAFGAFYLNGGNADIDANAWAVPLNANLALRIAGSRDSSNLAVFGGLHYTYMWIDVTAGTTDVYVYGPSYGPLFGVKAKLKFSETFSLIPFYIFQRFYFDYTVEVNGYAQDVDVDPVNAHLFGFDIELGPVSIGALFDMVNNSDTDKFTIIFSYDFDYSSSAPSETRAEPVAETPKAVQGRQPRR